MYTHMYWHTNICLYTSNLKDLTNYLEKQCKNISRTLLIQLERQYGAPTYKSINTRNSYYVSNLPTIQRLKYILLNHFFIGLYKFSLFEYRLMRVKVHICCINCQLSTLFSWVSVSHTVELFSSMVLLWLFGAWVTELYLLVLLYSNITCWKTAFP